MPNSVVKVHTFENYDVLMGFNPQDLFYHFNVDELHGLRLNDCLAYNNTDKDSYITGLCNISPDNKPFIFINLSRCYDKIETIGIVAHESAHLQFLLNGYCGEDDEEVWVTGLEEIVKNVMYCMLQHITYK